MSGMEEFVWARRYDWHDEPFGMHVVAYDAETDGLVIRPGICSETCDEWDSLLDAVAAMRWDDARDIVSAIPESEAIPKVPAQGLSEAIKRLDPWRGEREGASWKVWHCGGIRGERPPQGKPLVVHDRTSSCDIASIGWRFSKPGWEPSDGLALDEIRLAYRIALDEIGRVRGDGWMNTRTASIDACLHPLSEWRRETEGLDLAGFPWCVVIRQGESPTWVLHSLCRSESVARLVAGCHDIRLREGADRLTHAAPVVGAAPVASDDPDDIGIVVLESESNSPENYSQVAPWRVDAITQRHLTDLRSLAELRDVIDGYSGYPGQATWGESLAAGTETPQGALASVASHFGQHQTHMRYESVLRFVKDGEDEPTDAYRMFHYTEDELTDERYAEMFKGNAPGNPFSRGFLKDMADRRMTLSEVGEKGRMEVCFEEAVSFFGLPVRERIVRLRSFPMTFRPFRISWAKATDETCG